MNFKKILLLQQVLHSLQGISEEEMEEEIKRQGENSKRRRTYINDTVMPIYGPICNFCSGVISVMEKSIIPGSSMLAGALVYASNFTNNQAKQRLERLDRGLRIMYARELENSNEEKKIIGDLNPEQPTEKSSLESKSSSAYFSSDPRNYEDDDYYMRDSEYLSDISFSEYID